MGIVQVGDYTFYECNVAFHFERDNPYSPWMAIGIHLTHDKYCGVKYLPKFKSREVEFKSELSKIDSPYIRGGPEFLHAWCKSHTVATSVVGPVINYCTIYKGEYRFILLHLFAKYVGNLSPKAFYMLTIMLKSRKKYFASIFSDTGKSAKIVSALKEEGLL